MQTFLPVPDFAASAEYLDYERLNRQRIETYSIMEALAGVRDHLRHLPVVTMWRGSELHLVKYGLAMCDEWTRRGMDDKYGDRIKSLAEDVQGARVWTRAENDFVPWWLGIDGFHLSHRSNLLRMNPKHYRQYWPDTSDEFPLAWPEFRKYDGLAQRAKEVA